MQADGWGGRLPDCGTKGVSRGWGEGAGGGGCALTARHMEGCRFPPDRESGILNAYLRCYRWRSQRQRILYKAFWKAPLIFHQNCVYTRKQTKKEVCRLNPPCSFSLTHAHTHTPALFCTSDPSSLTLPFSLLFHPPCTARHYILFSCFLFRSYFSS